MFIITLIIINIVNGCFPIVVQEFANVNSIYLTSSTQDKSSHRLLFINFSAVQSILFSEPLYNIITLSAFHVY